MHVLSVISSKGGTGKTTPVANLGGFLADTGPGVVDLDAQPTLSSHFTLLRRTVGSTYGFTFESRTQRR